MRYEICMSGVAGLAWLSLRVINLIAISFDWRWTRTPLAGSDQHERSAVPELIILGDVQADHTATLQPNNTTRGKLNI